MGIAQPVTVGPGGVADGGVVAAPERATPASRVAVGALLREVADETRPWWAEAATTLGRPIGLTVDAAADMVVEAAADELRSAFAALVYSAIDGLPYGGAIRLAARRRGVRVEIDTLYLGIGVGGTGAVAARPELALDVVSRIAERHGGELTFETVAGRGARFRISLPAAFVPVVPAPTGPLGSPRPGSARILVVDDVRALGEAVSHVLRADGHTVVVATTADEALSRLSGERYDVVISDLGLGPGPSGWDLAEVTRRQSPTTAFYLMTGWQAQITPEEACARGVLGVLPKPCRAAHLRAAVNACVTATA